MQSGQLSATDRPAFVAYVGRVMRSVVVDYVRERQAAKRGGGVEMITLTTSVESERLDEQHLLAVNSAMDSLEKIAPDLHQLRNALFCRPVGKGDQRNKRRFCTHDRARVGTGARILAQTDGRDVIDGMGDRAAACRSGT